MRRTRLTVYGEHGFVLGPQQSHAADAAQHASPRQALTASRAAIPAMTNPAIGSAQLQPRRLFTARPMSKTAERYAHTRACLESAAADREGCPTCPPLRVRQHRHDYQAQCHYEQFARRTAAAHGGAAP